MKVVAAAALALAGSAQAATIDFDAASVGQLAHVPLPFPLSLGNAYVGQTYVEDGFQLKTTGFSALFAPDVSNIFYQGTPGSFAMADTIGGTVTLSKQGGGVFSLNSIDLTQLTHLPAAQGSSVTFTGKLANNSTVTQSFTFNGGWQTFNFSGFNNVVSVKFSESLNVNKDFTFDNINVSAVPEPETYAMLAAGLGLLGFMARRKKA